MKKHVAECLSDFEDQAQKTVSPAFELCESKIKASNGKVTPELMVLSTAASSREKVVAVPAAKNVFADSSSPRAHGCGLFEKICAVLNHKGDEHADV